MTLQARYTILRKIADGGTAEVFLATQHGAHGFEKPVVLKRIFPAFYADPQFRHMLVDEAHIAMSLNHSNIVQVLDLGEANGQYVLALELVDGWTLDAVLRRARALKTSIQPALALYLTAEVCRALAYAHAKAGPDGKPLGIVHRDISPHNVLLSEQGEVKLTDFGIAMSTNRRETSPGTIIKGKIAYMSPEQASAGTLDARSDLFSVGTMLYVMICRRYPFDAPTDLEVLLLVKKGEPVPPETARPGLNPEIYRVLKRAMARAPEERYQRAEEMLVDVEQVMRVAFRPVGQTELKRWLQDLSMRDGVPPLTRVDLPKSSAAGETLELRGVGPTPSATLPPPSSVGRGPRPTPTGSGSTPGKPAPPPPRAAMMVGRRPTPPPLPPLAARARSGAGVPGKLGETPPPRIETAAQSPSDDLFFDGDAEALTEEEPSAVEELSGEDVLAAADETAARSAPDAETNAEAAAAGGVVASPGAAALPDDADAKTPLPPTLPDATQPNVAEPIETAGAADRPKVDAFAPPAPAPPRRSSSWVAQAVAASAQRAGTVPAPPTVGPVIPPPVPHAPEAAAQPEAVAAPEASAGLRPARSRNARRAVAATMGIAAVLLIGAGIRNCSHRPAGQQARMAKPTAKPTATGAIADKTSASKAPADKATQNRGPTAVAATLSAPGGGGNSVGVTASGATSTKPAAALAANSAAQAPATSATGGDAGRGTLASASPPPAPGPSGSTPASSPTPPASAGTGSTPAVAKLAVKDAGAPIVTEMLTKSPVGSSPEAAPKQETRQEAKQEAKQETKSDSKESIDDGKLAAKIEIRTESNDPDGGVAGTPAAGATAKVVVLLRSTPPGAEVRTPHHKFGATPVAAKLRVGRAYSLTFKLDGYLPVTKQFRVANFPDQEVNATLHRNDGEAPATSTAPAAPPPAAKPVEHNWFQRMFTR